MRRWVVFVAFCTACIGELEAPDDAGATAAPAPDARAPSAPVDGPSPADARIVEPMPNQQGDPVPLCVTGTGTLGLKLRAGPGTEFAILATIPEGDAVEPLGPPTDGWLPVRYLATPGWVFGSYLTHC